MLQSVMSEIIFVRIALDFFCSSMYNGCSSMFVESFLTFIMVMVDLPGLAPGTSRVLRKVC